MMKVYGNYFLPFLSLRQAIPLLTFLKLGLPCLGGRTSPPSSLLPRVFLPPPPPSPILFDVTLLCPFIFLFPSCFPTTFAAERLFGFGLMARGSRLVVGMLLEFCRARWWAVLRRTWWWRTCVRSLPFMADL